MPWVIRTWNGGWKGYLGFCRRSTVISTAPNPEVFAFASARIDLARRYATKEEATSEAMTLKLTDPVWAGMELQVEELPKEVKRAADGTDGGGRPGTDGDHRLDTWDEVVSEDEGGDPEGEAP